MIQFIYTKPNGDESERLGIVLNAPSDNYLMLDLSDLDAEEIEQVRDLSVEYLRERNELLKKYGLTAYVKSFKKDRMSEILEDV